MIRPRLLFKFVLKIFYGSIVVENIHYIPETGRPWYDGSCLHICKAHFSSSIVSANHSNSLTDALYDAILPNSIYGILNSPKHFGYFDTFQSTPRVCGKGLAHIWKLETKHVAPHCKSYSIWAQDIHQLAY